MSRMVQATSIKNPPIVGLINKVGGACGIFGLKVPRIDEQKIIAEAKKLTGLDDFGDGAFLEGLRILIHSINQEAPLTTIGRTAFKSRLRNSLATRLRIIEFRKKHPEIDQQVIRKPVFILGLPRTGTTILYNLLAQDPASRSPLTWETRRPCPPATGPDTRIADTTKEIDAMMRLMPGYQAIHPMGAELPEECAEMMAHNLVSVRFLVQGMPSFDSWYKQQDFVGAYRFHKQFLQLLNYCNPGERWLLKDPTHLGRLDALLTVYPDARIIQTHRDPNQVLPSIGSIAYANFNITVKNFDVKQLGDNLINGFSSMMDTAIKFRQSLPKDNRQFYDMNFDSLMNDPFGSIKDIYAHFDMELTPKTEAAMQRFLAENNRGKHGKHHYTAEMYGMTREKIAQVFQPYCEYFGIAQAQP